MPTEIIRERNAAAGAWAAAAVVLAVGALLFGFTAHIRANDLEAQLVQLRTQTATVAGDPSGSGASGATSGGAAPATSATANAAGPTEAEGAARVAITRAFSTVYDSSRPVGDRLALIDDPAGIGDALAAAEAGENGALIRQVVISVNDVRFSTPAAAQVAYTLTVPNMAPITGRSGAAVFLDGVWKVSRTTICGDLVQIGSGC
ncbi:MAG: hypothetical protein GX868_09680 [Actinobacteria bacterium]|nr:hypothetical protein [Actinomycetota bacterium]